MQLTEKVLCYQCGNWTWRNLWGHMQLLIDEFLAYHSLCPDVQARFLNQFEPRLLGMVERFEYRGITFEALLRRSLRLQLRSVFRQVKKERLLFSLATEELDGIARDDPSSVLESADSDTSQVARPARSSLRYRSFPELTVSERRCIVAALKNTLHLDDKLCRQLAQSFSLDPEWLLNCRDALYQDIHPKLEAKRLLLEQLAHLRHEWQVELALQGAEPSDPLSRQRSAMRERRIQRLRDRLQAWQISPRHHRIAAVLGIPKGTVDSTLYYVRKATTGKPGTDD